MTEAEWQAATDPDRMLALFNKDWQTLDDLRHGFPHDRKLQLFTVECCRRLWPLLPDERYRRVIDLAGELTEGLATKQQLERARNGIHGNVGRTDVNAYYAVDYLAMLACNNPRSSIAYYVSHKAADAMGTGREGAAQCDLLRDLFGPLLFRSPTLDHAWLTSTALALAREMYDTRDFAAMPILADALQDAGCENADILTHCRGPEAHVRGCWVVDAILNKG
jgi:hypothetical protein